MCPNDPWCEVVWSFMTQGKQGFGEATPLKTGLELGHDGEHTVARAAGHSPKR